MPMFDLEKAGEVRLRDCSTTSETMLKSKEVEVVDVERCSTGVTQAAPSSKWSKVKSFCVARVFEILGAVIAAVVTAIYAPVIVSSFF